MLSYLLRTALPVILAGTLAPTLARADIYTWTDVSGKINISNITPPQGVQVTSVVHESAQKSAPRIDAARDAAHDAEMQALEERVRQLQDEVELAKRPVPAQAEYRPMPTAMPYGADLAPAPAQYADDSAPAAYAGCDPTWAGCGSWWGPGFYPASVIVLRAPSFRRIRPIRGERHVVAHQPMRMSGGFHRR